jgi:hypothetical protein
MANVTTNVTVVNSQVVMKTAAVPVSYLKDRKKLQWWSGKRDVKINY